jgi:HEAT repeat
MIADKFVQLANVVGLDIIKEDLTPVFLHLLKDNESEVRTAACNQVPGFCAFISPTIVSLEVLPCVKDLTTDTSTHVRAALANHISGLAPILGKQPTIDQLLPLFLQLLKDEASEVRLNIISKLDGVNQGKFVSIDYQLSEFNFYLNLFFRQLLSWQKTNNGELEWRSLRISHFLQVNLEYNSLTKSWVICACLGWEI